MSIEQKKWTTSLVKTKHKDCVVVPGVIHIKPAEIVESFRNVIVIFALVTDLVDFLHEAFRLEVRKEKFSDGALFFLYCGCFFYIFYSATTLINQLMFCTCRSLSDIDKPSCLVVWLGDMPQAVYDIQFSKESLDPRTIYGWPHAVAVLAVTLIRIVLLIARRYKYNDEERRSVYQKLQMVGLGLNLSLAVIALGKMNPQLEL